MRKIQKNNNYWDIFIELVRTDFIMRYHNSVLGFIWVILKPLLTFLIIFLVFSRIFKSNDPYYHLNLLLGILIYSFFAESTLQGIKALFEKSTIILKVNFPKVITIFASTTNSLISLIFGFLVFISFWFIEFSPNSLIYIPYFFFLICTLTVLIIGISFFLSIVYIKLRDLYSIWEVLLQLLFYSTPIIYPLTIIPDSIQKIAMLNPLAIVVVQSQKTLINGQAPDFSYLIYLIILSLAIFASGFLFFNKFIHKIAEDF